jgi:hypothetical protein
MIVVTNIFLKKLIINIKCFCFYQEKFHLIMQTSLLRKGNLEILQRRWFRLQKNIILPAC